MQEQEEGQKLMKKGKFNKVMKVIGQREGISPKEVEKEIQKAIDAAFYSSDMETKVEWAKIPCKGERPTPEEFIDYMSEKVNETVK